MLLYIVMIVGYARVSTLDQSLDLQIDALKRDGCEKIFIDKCSGSIADRPELKKMKNILRKGDKVIVWKLDRLFRSLKHLIEWADYFDKQGIELKSLQDSIDTSSSMGKFMFHILGAVAQLEKDIIGERTKAGLAAARARGRVGGRPRKIDAKKWKRMLEMHRKGDLSVREICEYGQVSKGTFYNYLKKGS